MEIVTTDERRLTCTRLQSRKYIRQRSEYTHLEVVSKARSRLHHVDDKATVERKSVDTSFNYDLKRRLGVTVNIQRCVAAVGAYYQERTPTDEARYDPLNNRSVPVTTRGRVVAVVDGHDRRLTTDTGRDAQRKQHVRAASGHDQHCVKRTRAGRLSLLSYAG